MAGRLNYNSSRRFTRAQRADVVRRPGDYVPMATAEQNALIRELGGRRFDLTEVQARMAIKALRERQGRQGRRGQ